jgi:Ras-related protein Rab-32
MTSSGPKEYIYKVLVIGNGTVGKTSIIKRYVHDFFLNSYKMTIGVDFALKRLEWDQNTIIQLQLWDIAGQERFGNMTRVYYKQAVGAIICYDITVPKTFDDVLTWKQDLDSKVTLPDGSTPVPCLLLANKVDLLPEGTQLPEGMNDFCKKNGFIGVYQTSALTGHNIDKAIRYLVEQIMSKNLEELEEQHKPPTGPSITVDVLKQTDPKSGSSGTNGTASGGDTGGGCKC